MWRDEIKWIIGQLDEHLSEDARTCLNIGSDSEEYRAVKQPWIKEDLYAYLEGKGLGIKNMDIDPDCEPDYVHDIAADPDGLPLFDLVLANHLLEHVYWDQFSKAVRNIETLVTDGGILVVSVPNKYPIHHRPIDNLWRPSAEELVEPFNGVVRQAETFEVSHDNPAYYRKPLTKLSIAMLSY